MRRQEVEVAAVPAIPTLDEAGFAVGGHVNHAKPTAGKPPIYTYNAAPAERGSLRRGWFSCVDVRWVLRCCAGCVVYSSCPRAAMAKTAIALQPLRARALKGF